MLNKITDILSRFIKSFSVETCKNAVYNHITSLILSSSFITIIASQYSKIRAGVLANCKYEWWGCAMKLSEPLLIIISFSLMWLYILRSEEKFSQKPHKISEGIKKEIKTVIAKYYHILATERKVLGVVQAQALQYFKELPSDFDTISQNPEVVEDESLFRMIDNARNRAGVILNMAANVVSEQERSMGNKMTNHEYLQSIETIFSQFEGHKKEIFQHLKNL